MHDVYGANRPSMRGALHGLVAVALLEGVLLCVVWIMTGILEPHWWRLVFLLIGKLTSYVSSSLFHVTPSVRPEQRAVFLRWDLVTISIAIWAPSGAFASDIVEWLLLLAFMVCVTTLNLVLVYRQFGTPPQSPLARSILLGLYFIFSVSHIGWHYGCRSRLIVGVSFYLVGFLLGPPLHHLYRPAFWHSAVFNSWHEDAHILIVVADGYFLAMAVEFLAHQD